MILKPVDKAQYEALEQCDHEPGSHTPFKDYSAHCSSCGAIYVVRGCADEQDPKMRRLPPDIKTSGTFGVVDVGCVCGTSVDVGVPPNALPETLVASRWSGPPPPPSRR